MRRLLAAATLAVALVPAAAFDAAAASGVVMMKTFRLKCETGTGPYSSYITVWNTTGQTIPANTRLTVDVLDKISNRHVALRKTLSPQSAIKSNFGASFLNRAYGYKQPLSCSATVQLAPDYTRR